MSLSLVVFAYNEEESVEATILEVQSTLSQIGDPFEIVIIDDGSTDGTGAIINRLEKDILEVRVVGHQTNRGLGGAYRSGFYESKMDSLMFWAADGQMEPETIPQFYPLMKQYDMVLGYLPNRKRTLVGRVLSLSEKVLYRVIIGKMPKFQGVLMFRRALLDKIPLHSQGRGWGVLMEFIVKVHRGGYSITSIPTGLRPRAYGVSKVNNMRTILSNVVQLAELRLKILK